MNKNIIDSGQLVAHICERNNSVVRVNCENVGVEAYRYLCDAIVIDIFSIDGKIDVKLAIEKSDAESLIKQIQQAIDNCRHT